MYENENGRETGHQRRKSATRNYASLRLKPRRWSVVKKARALGSKLAAFIDFLSSARKEVLDREQGAWVHERRRDLTREQYEERLALKDTAQLLLETRLKVLRVANIAHRNYERVEEKEPDRADEVTRLATQMTVNAYKTLHQRSKVSLIPVFDKKKASRSKAITTFWNVAMVTLMGANAVANGHAGGLRAAHRMQEVAMYSDSPAQAHISAPSSSFDPFATHTVQNSPFKNDKARAEFGEKAAKAVEGWVEMKRKSMGSTKLNSPYFVFVPMRPTEEGNRIREHFDVGGRPKELKMGGDHVPYR